jgi:hypothetical protein
VEEVEVQACWEGARVAAEWGMEKTILESDCLSVITALNNYAESKSNLCFLLKEIKEFSESLLEIRFLLLGESETE